MKYITITTFLKDIPEVRKFIVEFLNLQWEDKNVGQEYRYDRSVSDNDLYKFHGTLMELFIRKCICQKLNIPCRDDRTEKILLMPHKFDFDYMHEGLLKYYAAFKNPNIYPIDAIEDMKYVALSEELPPCEDTSYFEDIVYMEVNVYNLQAIMKYVDKIPYKQMVSKKSCELPLNTGHILTGAPDYIFDDKIFCQITTSMYYGNPKEKLAQVVLYIMAYYREYYYGTVQEFTIEMYNPLLGNTHTTRLELTPGKFNRLLERVNTLAHNFYGQYNPFTSVVYIREK